MSLDLSLDAFNVLCTKSEGRDKVARLVQYAARAFVGCTSPLHPKAHTPLHTAQAHARTIMTSLGSARRTHRWCKEIPVIINLPKSFQIKDPIDSILDLMQKLSLITFLMTDHLAMLKQWNFLSAGKRSAAQTVQAALKFFCISNTFALIIQLKKYLSLPKDEEKASQRKECLKAAFKAFLLMIQTAHLSLVYQTHDSIVGIAGIISSWMDVQAQWPKKKIA
mmetsp:Transcript_57997/g.123212  ORF Transcript_57997/g.123212 Transcript_57997/m.123212 type:complete len:222 (+) Transcript_57997:108-773(+)|eukprot:CAMPEP_0206456758 /NCGR_PEP_ID=MMETSP0324_2-20121206/22559_1 /ASSEMBLY_ACC=CAM_ASM_000836 /TAXON_ID=2866 /ORGANISM="Crypthecodinium cohnii, Strain Seligo" /LENGTH=221 /DNA_ID=CAMNT_0053927755 /DNA_START=111 /DNA_END=776 /DNA_ORIENTATION=-